MRIVKCSDCGRLIHYDKTCLFCGSSSENPEVSQAVVHENAQSAFKMAEMFVAQGQFEDALESLGEVFVWSPNSSEAHWLRLLARSSCKNDRELFLGGVSVSELPDYDAAIRFASDDEKMVYSSVGDACAALKSTLMRMIRSRNSMVMQKLNIADTLSAMQGFISEKRKVLLSTWQELRKCEQELKLLENEGEYYIHECRENTEYVRSRSMNIRRSLENTSELEKKQFFKYKIQLGGLKSVADGAKEEYYRLKSSHPSVPAFTELSQKRDKLKDALYAQLEEVKAYEKEIEALISQINSEKEYGKKLLEMAQSVHYGQVKDKLGQKNYERAVQYVLTQK